MKKLAAALAKAQLSFEQIKKDKTVRVRTKTGGEYTFSYAPLESIICAVRPALAANNLFITQALTSIDGNDFIETTLVHASGEFLQNLVPVLVQEQGPQAYGSAITYARRYGVTTLLCIVAEDDDDANGAEGNSMQPASKAAPRGKTTGAEVKLIDADQAEKLRTTLKDLNGDEPAFAKFFGVQSLEKLPASQWAAAQAALEAKRRKMQEAIELEARQAAQGA
jgi:hypothetical protein